jgi:hypothetical protein
MVLGDVERLRAVAERMLSEPLEPLTPAAGARADDMASPAPGGTVIVSPGPDVSSRADAGTRAPTQ